MQFLSVFNFKDPATVYAYSLIFVHHQVVWFMILILAIVYWSFFRLVKDYNWFSFNKQLGSTAFLAVYFLFLSYIKNLLLLLLFLPTYSLLYFYRFFFFYNNLWFLIWVYYWDFMRWRLEYYPSFILLICNYAWMRVSLSIHIIFHSTSVFKEISYFLAFIKEFYSFNNQLNLTQKIIKIKSFILGYTIERYAYYYLFNRSANAYVFSAYDREDKDILTSQSFRDNILLEYIWAFFPSLIILLILIPSLYLLYSSEENLDPRFNVKIIGHQWFWSYEFDVYDLDLSIEFESNLIPENDLLKGSKRLLEVDNRLYLPVNIPLRFLITSSDVLHSWAVPEMGIKVDAVPGRLNDVVTLIQRPGVFYGQCSELCGVGHGFMPIVIEACAYNKWLLMINN